MTSSQLPDYEVRYAESRRELRAALAVEDAVFREKHFVPVGDLYARYLPQSFLIAAFASDGTCLGVSRMVESRPLMPPVLDEEHHVDIAVEPEKWHHLAEEGLLDEFATIAVSAEYRNSTVTLDLIRFGYRHARHMTTARFGDRPRVGYVSAILDPGVAWGLRLRWHFPFQRIGPPQHYMEGTEYREEALTAPYVVDLGAMEAYFEVDTPSYLHWMQDDRMSNHVPPRLPLIRRNDPLLLGCEPIEPIEPSESVPTRTRGEH
jgi:hypothetical protein